MSRLREIVRVREMLLAVNTKEGQDKGQAVFELFDYLCSNRRKIIKIRKFHRAARLKLIEAKDHWPHLNFGRFSAFLDSVEASF